jgi:hypothetical protein
MDLAAHQLSLEAFYSELESLGAGYTSVFTLHPGCNLKLCGEYSTSSVIVPAIKPLMP